MTAGPACPHARALLAVLLGLQLTACASSRPAPIVYAGSPNGALARTLAPGEGEHRRAAPADTVRAPVILPGLAPSECVPFARSRSGVQIWGDAVTWWRQAEGRYVRSSRPAEGSVMVMKGYMDDTRGHVAVVSARVSERMILVDHANWLRSGETSINVPVYDVSASNDWSEVRVWHIPGGHWGGRIYSTEGFIHPFRLDGAAGS